MLTIPIDSNLLTPMYQQIYEYIKSEIQSGALSQGEKLPSTRLLAGHLSVSRNTVDMAYEQLLSEGYLEVFPKRGYFVSQVALLNRIENTKIVPDHKMVSAILQPDYLYDFSPFAVDLAHFPYHTWRQLSKNCLQDNTELFLLGNNQGDLPLRHAISHYLHQSRSVNCTEDQIVVGAGVDYLLLLLCDLLGKEKRVIAMENPAYQRAYRLFREKGHEVVPIPLDSSGMSVDELKRSNCNVAYVTPSHQYPLGIIMPIRRRIELLNWANEASDRYLIEDDHDSEFRYKGKPIPSLQGTALSENVIYIGTFSKAIAPAIRVGYMVLPPKLLQIYREHYSFYASTVSRIDQAILTEFLSKGYFERHLNRMRKVYKSKHDCLLSHLRTLPLPLSISGENAGMHLVVTIKNGESQDSLIRKAQAHRIKLYGLKEHFLNIPPDYEATFLFGYANLSEEAIESGIHALQNAWDATT